jgi:hypothetical protein
MSYGCFVDIIQQDGTPVRMHYDGVGIDTVLQVKWMGIMEQMAEKFNEGKRAKDEVT